MLACYTNCVSPHQLPLAQEIVRRVGSENFRYVYRDERSQERTVAWWNDEELPEWCKRGDENTPELLAADVLYCGGLRPFGLCEKRLENGKKTLYMTERWFKPPIGMLRLLHPRYFRYARRLAKMMDNHNFMVLPIGVHAAKDIARLCGLMHGDLRCLFRSPRLEFERKPGGRVYLATKDAKSAKKFCLDKMRMWGYFVASSQELGVSSQGLGNHSRLTTNNYHLTTKKVLWVGRLLKLKWVDTIIRAVGELSRDHTTSQRLTTNNYPLTTTLDIYGTGPEENRLKKLAAKYGDAVKFHPPVPIAEVRKLMREHDIYVLASNAYEGWGAVVSEALEEGMKVIGTYEAGASATILPKERLFHSGDCNALVAIIEKECKGALPPCTIGNWTADKAADMLCRIPIDQKLITND